MTAVALPDRPAELPSLEELREEFRAWIADHLRPEWVARPVPTMFPPPETDPEGVAASRAWHAALYADGWIAPGWPVEHGGRGYDLARRLVIAEELALARAPIPIGFQGVDLLGPTLIEHATAEQAARFLPDIASGDVIWCQGYSEPDAGSDLSNLRTRAEEDGDDFVINGQKVWTSFGDRSTWCFLLARTSSAGRPQEGITFFLAAMDTPGLEWRPVRGMPGAAEFGELYLTDVRIPRSQVVGGVGDGWRIAMSSLSHERLISTNAAVLRSRFDALLDLARLAPLRPVVRDRIATMACHLQGLVGLQSRALHMSTTGDPRSGAWVSLVKIRGSELRVAIAELAVELLAGDATVAGSYDVPAPASDLAGVWVAELLDSKGGTIYAGSNEIQRNIISERGLGLPREPAAGRP